MTRDQMGENGTMNTVGENVRRWMDELNTIRFKGLETYCVGSALPMMATNVHFNSQMSVKNKLWSMLQWMLFERIQYLYDRHQGKILCIYSDERFVRTDYLKIFGNVKSLLGADSLMAQKQTKKRLRGVKEWFRRSVFLINWLSGLKKSGLDVRNTLRVITDIMRIFDIIQYLETFDCCGLEGAIVFCDIFPADNACVQYFSKKNITTMTLQHAAFTAPLENPTNINDTGIELTYSIADYFLGWNQFSKDQAMRCGMEEAKFKIVGIPHFIGFEELPEQKTSEKKCFGVVLGVKEYDDVNKKAISLANQIAEQYDLQFYLKYHPTFSGNEYANLVNAHCLGCFPSRGRDEYIKAVDFSVLSVTGMFIELLFLGHPIYRVAVEEDRDKFHEVSLGMFDSMEAFQEIFGKPQNELFAYLCGTKDPARLYFNEIQKILGGEK